MIISRRFEKHADWGTPGSLLDDTAWSDVAGSVAWTMNTCVDSVNVLRTEGAPFRIKGGMRDIGLHPWGLGIGVHDEHSDDMDMEVEDSGESTESQGAFPSSENGAVTIAEDGLVSVTVGLPRRFGNPVCSDEDPESPVTHVVTPDPVTAPSDNNNSNSNSNNNNNTLREILRKVTVNETTLLAAIETLGGGVKGLEAVVEYVKHLDPNAGNNNINPADFTRGLEQFCLLNNQTKEVAAPDAGEAPGTNDGSQARIDPSPYTMGYMDPYFPNFCYPYPPPFAGFGAFNMGVRPMYVPMVGVPYFPPPAHEYVPSRTDAITRASRKSRIARRRGQGGADFHHTRTVTTTKSATHAGGASVAQSGNHSNQVSTSHQNHTVSSSRKVAQGLSSRDLMLVLQKQLSPSGVSSLGRIVLPKKEAETHLPQLVASEGVLLTMKDYDTAQRWTFRYRFWSNNKSRMYLLENTRDFVKAHNLQERDMLSLYRDAEGSYVVRGEKDSSNQTGDAANDAAAEYIPTEEDLLQKKQKL